MLEPGHDSPMMAHRAHNLLPGVMSVDFSCSLEADQVVETLSIPRLFALLPNLITADVSCCQMTVGNMCDNCPDVASLTWKHSDLSICLNGRGVSHLNNLSELNVDGSCLYSLRDDRATTALGYETTGTFDETNHYL